MRISVYGNSCPNVPLIFIAQCIVTEFPGSRGASFEPRADVMQIYVGDDILSL